MSRSAGDVSWSKRTSARHGSSRGTKQRSMAMGSTRHGREGKGQGSRREGRAEASEGGHQALGLCRGSKGSRKLPHAGKEIEGLQWSTWEKHGPAGGEENLASLSRELGERQAGLARGTVQKQAKQASWATREGG